MEQATVNGIVVNLVEASDIQDMDQRGTLDFVEEIFLGETEFKGEGIYKLYYYHQSEKFYAVWDRSRDYENSHIV